MKKQVLLCTMVLLFIAPVIVNAATPNRSSITPKSTIDIWVDGWSSYYYYWTSLDTSDTIYVEFEVTSGAGIDFWISDDYNYERWNLGYASDAYATKNNVGSGNTVFNIPYADEWRVVFYNDDLLQTKHIEGYVGLSPQFVPTSVDTTFIILVLFMVVVIVASAWEGYKRTQQPKASGYPPEMLPRISQQQIQQPTPRQPTNFCPYCGTPRQSSTAQFCATCGRAFEGPNLG